MFGHVYPFSADNPLGDASITSYNWWTTSPNIWIPSPAVSQIINVSSSTPGVHDLYLTATNACGTSLTQVLGVYVASCSPFRYTVYPNPVKDVLHIAFENTDNLAALPKNVKLYSEMSGKEVKTVSMKTVYDQGLLKNGGKFELDVKDLPRGTYYLHLVGGGVEKVEKIRILLE